MVVARVPKKPNSKWKQLTLASTLRVAEPRPARRTLRRVGAPRATDNPVVVELFCGLGGWTEGCRRARFETVLAIDCNMALLRLHKANHPRCTQVEMPLGPATEEELVRLVRAHVPEGQRWHLHGSPPCQRISTASAMYGYNSANDGMELVVWYLALVLRLKPDTWSMEEVPHQQLTGALTMARTLHPTVIDFEPSLCMGDYGVPQRRKRCIAGTPRLIQALRNDERLRKPAPVLSAVLAPPEGATICMAAIGRLPDPAQNTRQPDGTYTNPTIRRCMRSVNVVAWTCVARHRHIWCTPDYRVVRHFTMKEHLRLQTFSETYQTGASQPLATTGVGNAVPPLFARKFMSCIVRTATAPSA